MLAIIILTHNNLSSTKKCIKALYKYTKNFQLIIIDNASTDGTIKYLKQLSKNHNNITIEFNANNQGIIRTRNHGYQISKNLNPSHIFFIDNDQIVQPEWQNSYSKFFNKRYDIVGQIAWKIRAKDYYPYKMIKDKTEEFNYVSCGGMMIKTSVIEDIGLFDERFDFIYWEDPDFCFTAHSKGYRIGWNDSPVIEHQKHSLKLHGKRKKYFMENWKKFQDKWKDHKMPVFKNDFVFPNLLLKLL